MWQGSCSSGIALSHSQDLDLQGGPQRSSAFAGLASRRGSRWVGRAWEQVPLGKRCRHTLSQVVVVMGMIFWTALLQDHDKTDGRSDRNTGQAPTEPRLCEGSRGMGKKKFLIIPKNAKPPNIPFGSTWVKKTDKHLRPIPLPVKQNLVVLGNIILRCIHRMDFCSSLSPPDASPTLNCSRVKPSLSLAAQKPLCLDFLSKSAYPEIEPPMLFKA